MNVSKGVVISSIWVFFIHLWPLAAQQPQSFKNADSEYNRAMELYEKQKYGAAQHHFRKAMEGYTGYDTELKTDAAFYSALCASHLYNEDAEYLLLKFIEHHPESPKANLARYELAKFHYQNKNYRRSAGYFEEVDRLALAEEDMAEFYFKSGYSYFMIKEMEKASLAFFEIKDINTDYTSPATYYYAHIAYSDKNYETALTEFRRLTDDESFGAVVPFYIVQILYLQKKYDEILAYAPPLLESATPQRTLEIEKFIGDAWFHKGEYANALPHLEKYASDPSLLTREDRYQLGYAYYRTSDFRQAIPSFERVTGREDLLSQNAYYLLADCYLRTDQKDRARMAFSSASKMEFDETIREDALFNFAKITYELSYSPFNEAIRTLNQYIELYPYSNRIDEAYEFLMQAYMNTRNYQDALESLEKILNKNDRIQAACQRVAFYRGLELFKNLKFDEALDHFDKSLQYARFDRNIKARSLYWRGEASYRLNDPGTALEDFNDFLMTPGAFSLDEYSTAHYNIGYIFFNDRKYSDALVWFRKYEGLVRNQKTVMLGDALNRIADCYFITSDYQAANTYYQRTIDLALSGTDYAMFQKGFTMGLMNNHGEEIRILTNLIRNMPGSAYVDDALFERGRSYVKINDNQKAITDYLTIINERGNSAYVPKSLVQLGLVYYDMDRYREAIDQFKKVVASYRGSEEAQNALTGLKNVYVELNEVEEYFAYIRSLGEGLDIPLSEQDSLTYIAGENLYMSGNRERAAQSLGAYIQQFPSGSFLINAHFYKAECEMSLGNRETALNSYNYVIRGPRSLFTEPALAAAADIHFRERNYAEAAEKYGVLENVAELPDNILTARLGLMRCFHMLKDDRNTIAAARKLLLSDKISEELAREAFFRIAKAHYSLGELTEARASFNRLATEVKSLEGAESKYRVAEISFRAGKIDEAEKLVNEFLQGSTPHPYWMARVFILDADIKISRKDLFQAKHTLQSVIDYYEVADDGIIAEAKKKLDEIREMEKSLNNPPPRENTERLQSTPYPAGERGIHPGMMAGLKNHLS